MNEPAVIVKLLRAIASGTNAMQDKHDIIFRAAADLIETQAATIKRLERKVSQ